MKERYKNNLASKITNIAYDYFETINGVASQHGYHEGLIKMFSQTERDLKEIAFKFFDTNGDGRLSERDMFELMQ